MLIDSIFLGNKEGILTYSKLLDNILRRSKVGLLLPQDFYIPADQIERKTAHPGFVNIILSDVSSTEGIFIRGQSVYLLSQL
jgi:hypothetical protein